MIGRALILTIFAMFVVSMMVTRVITRSTTAQNDNVVRHFQRVTGRDIAQTGVNLALRRLATNSLWRTGYSKLGVSGGKVTVSFLDTVFRRDSQSPLIAAVKIISTAYVPFISATDTVSDRDTSFTTIAYIPRGFVPSGNGGVRGVITTHNRITTGGNVTIDGRDHDTSGTVLPNQGMFGVWTTDTLIQGGSSTIGGTNIRGVDYAPVGKTPGPDTSIIRQKQPGPYPGTPDSVMGGAVNGYPEGTLKSIAQSGINGSQYVTSPTFLTYPLRGVTYVELPDTNAAIFWNPCNIRGSGILICHNASKTAFMKDIQPSTFYGLLIADDIAHINSTFTVYGAVVGLTSNPSTVNDLGNGNSKVLFSSIAIENATSLIKPIIINTYTNKVLAWWE
ncbi:MAG: hypothetical protein HYR76_01535 [Ignavibacteria bacterium]|nr:hypothetical protein [Ignavibacteria bacterium]MBI3766361.1 hypothetical protein [Ignavibacteriales bacterium]